MTEDLLREVQTLEQNLHHALVQKQSLQSDERETRSAIEHLKNATECYVNIGNIMVKKKANETTAELQEKLEMLQTRIKSISAHEAKLSLRRAELQKDILRKIGDDNGQS